MPIGNKAFTFSTIASMKKLMISLSIPEPILMHLLTSSKTGKQLFVNLQSGVINYSSKVVQYAIEIKHLICLKMENRTNTAATFVRTWDSH